MPIIILLLVAILIVLVAGPLALAGAVAVPVALLLTAPIKPFLWFFGLAFLSIAVVGFLLAGRSAKPALDGQGRSIAGKVRGPKCGNVRDAGFAFCFKCEEIKLPK